MADQITINARLQNLGWTGCPADMIVNQPGHLLAGIQPHQQLWEELNMNVYRHAFANNWGWHSSSYGCGNLAYSGPVGGGPNGPPAKPNAGLLGVPFLDGTKQAPLLLNCGAFNTLVRQLAWHVFHFQNNEVAKASTPKSFVTPPNTQTFDSVWSGNVRTVATDFPLLRAFKFDKHAYSTHPAGGFSDATCGVRQFQQESDLFWFDLTPPDKLDADTDSMYKVSTVYRHQTQMPPGQATYFLICRMQ